MIAPTLRTSDFDYDLPQELIAQDPAAARDDSRLLVVRRDTGRCHDRFSNIAAYLLAGDVLVLNRSRVLQARLRAYRPSGGSLELLVLRPSEGACWVAMARPSRKLAPGMELRIAGTEARANVDRSLGDGLWIIRFDDGCDVRHLLEEVGELPLPPYIRNTSAPAERYQTVYADRAGSVAAPTAGLHFTHELIHSLQRVGVEVRYVTLHVGLGTFKPVTVEDVEQHTMHAEWGEIPEDVAVAVNSARREGRRVIAVGTTTTRLLESAFSGEGLLPWTGMTDRFIYPGYRFRSIDGLLTNFHLPRSTLLMLVSAFAGREPVLSAYQEAIELRYRFFSFGDAMLIL